MARNELVHNMPNFYIRLGHCVGREGEDRTWSKVSPANLRVGK